MYTLLRSIRHYYGTCSYNADNFKVYREFISSASPCIQTFWSHSIKHSWILMYMKNDIEHEVKLSRRAFKHNICTCHCLVVTKTSIFISKLIVSFFSHSSCGCCPKSENRFRAHHLNFAVHPAVILLNLQLYVNIV